jgi:diacylglycerol kinase family enzyme
MSGLIIRFSPSDIGLNMKHSLIAKPANPTIQLVFNPEAGGHCARKLAALAAALEGAGATVIRSECGPNRHFEVDLRADHLCVAGGDGTARHVAMAAIAAGRPVSISIFPAGTVNLLHREFGGAADAGQHATRILAATEPRRHYAASLGENLFLACASVGPDSFAVAGLSAPLKRRIGRLAYGVAFLTVLLKWPRQPITLRSEDRTIRCEAFYVAKGRFFAGPWSFAPEARLDDPRLHVVALERLTRFRYLRFLWTMLTGGQVDRLPGATCFSCTMLEADCAEPLPVQADGDVAATLPVTMKVKPEPFAFR